MDRKDEISSTEKLLDLIRTPTPSPSRSAEEKPVRPSSPLPLFRTLAFQRNIGIGVEIGNHDIKVAKIHRLSDKSYELLNYTSIAVSMQAAIDSPQVSKSLAKVLSSFCRGLKRYDIWCCMASASVETRCLRIPKLPKKQIANAVFWTFSKEVSVNEKEMMLDFSVLGDVNENGATKTQVMAFTIPIAQTESLKRLFSRIGHPLSGISIVPFAIQNLLKTGIVQSRGTNACCLFIGRDWSRIAVYANGNLILSRAIKAGMHSMIEAIVEYRRQSALHGDHFPKGDGRRGPDDSPEAEEGSHYRQAQELFDRFLNAGEANGAQTVQDLDVYPIILPAVERLVKQVERTIAHFCLHFHQTGVHEVFISGRVTANPAIVEDIGAQLGAPVTVLNPFPTSATFAQQVTIPASAVDRESFVPSVGIGLSTNEMTPNFLFTHRHREKQDRAHRIRVGMAAASIGLLVLLLFSFLWQEHRITVKAAEVEHLTQERDDFNVPLTQDLVTALLSKVNQKRTRIATLGQRYFCSAVISEVTQLTPPHIKLVQLNIDMGTPSGKKSRHPTPTMVIEGIVTGEQIRFETDLASFMLTMESSLLFKTPVVKSKQIQFIDDRPVMRFALEFELA